MAIEKELLDQLLAGRDPNEVFARDGDETTLPVLFVREATLRTTNISSSASQASPPEIFAEVLFYGALQPAAVVPSGKKP